MKAKYLNEMENRSIDYPKSHPQGVIDKEFIHDNRGKLSERCRVIVTKEAHKAFKNLHK